VSTNERQTRNYLAELWQITRLLRPRLARESEYREQLIAAGCLGCFGGYWV
jgi:hypothetical protein